MIMIKGGTAPYLGPLGTILCTLSLLVAGGDNDPSACSISVILMSTAI